MKKSLLLALPLAAGLFATSGAYAASSNPCSITSTSINAESFSNTECTSFSLDASSDAISVSGPGATLTLNKNVVINGNGKRLHGKVIIAQGADNVTFNNMYIQSDMTPTPAIIDVQNTTNLTLNNVFVYWGNADDWATKFLTNGYGIDVKGGGAGSTINVQGGSHIASKVAIRVQSGNNTINIADSDLQATQAIALLGVAPNGGTAANNRIDVSDSTIYGFASDDSKGAIYIDHNNRASINISNTYLANNFANNGSREDLIYISDAHTPSTSVSVYVSNSNLDNTAGDLSGNGSVVFNSNGVPSSFVADNTSILGSGAGAKVNSDYQVTLDYNDVAHDMKRLIAVDKGASVSPEQIPADPTLAGSIFSGWFINDDSTKPFDAAQPLSESVSVYAQYRTMAAPNPGDNNTPGSGNSNTPGSGGVAAPNAGDVENPNTADNISAYVVVATFALLGLGATIFAGKKANR